MQPADSSCFNTYPHLSFFNFCLSSSLFPVNLCNNHFTKFFLMNLVILDTDVFLQVKSWIMKNLSNSLMTSRYHPLQRNLFVRFSEIGNYLPPGLLILYVVVYIDNDETSGWPMHFLSWNYHYLPWIKQFCYWIFQIRMSIHANAVLYCLLITV